LDFDQGSNDVSLGGCGIGADKDKGLIGGTIVGDLNLIGDVLKGFISPSETREACGGSV
jgi:hypothetical protein